MISNPADRKKIRDALEEISNSLTRIEAEQDLIKQIKSDLAEEYELPKKLVAKLARVFHKRNFQEEQAVQSEFETLYQEIVTLSSGQSNS